jgi:aldehyde dehydrogenase (NAD+)
MADLEILNPETRNLIDGELVASSAGTVFENINPATEEVLGATADGTPEDMHRAIAAARRAFDETDWSTDAAFRSKCMRQFSDALKEAREQFRSIVVFEAGSPVLLTYHAQVDSYIDSMPYWADFAGNYVYEERMTNSEFMGAPQGRIIRHEAVGVVGAITAWNFPLYLNLCKVGPALAAGNTVVLKPPPDTPWSATHLGKLIAESTDIPAGVINIVASSDHGLGEMLTTDPRVDQITFTGSTATGRRVMQAASATVKKVFLELGGKSANVMLDDCNLPETMGMVAAMCTHGGQGCALTTRLLRPRSRYEEGIEIAKNSFENFPYGDPTNPGNLQGPQVSKKQQASVLAHIETARKEGATVMVGGGIPAHLDKGYFVEPTLLTDVDADSTIAQEEVFGPVLCVIPFDDDDDAVAIANNSIFGLSGAISSADPERALAVARRIRTGTLSINGAQWFSVDTPFGGYRQSGVGRENGREGFEEYLQTKVIAVPAT